MAWRDMLNRRSAAGWLYIPVAAFSGLVSSSAVLANLPATGSGLFFLCQGMMPFLLLFDLGLLVVGTREIAFAAGRERGVPPSSSEVGSILRTYLRFRDARFISLILVTLCALVCVAFMAASPPLRANANAQAVTLCAIASSMVLSSFAYQSFLEGTGNYHLDRLASTGTILVSGMAIAAAAYWGRTFWWVMGAWYAGQLLTVFVKAVIAHRLEPGIHRVARPQARAMGFTLKQSSSLFLIQIGAAATKYIQYPIITDVLGVAALGTYFFVARITGTLDAAISVLNASQRAIFSQLYAGGRYAEARQLMLAVLKQVLVLTIIGAIGITFVLPSLVRLFTNHAGVSAVPFWVLGLDLISMCTSGMMTQFVIASGRNPFPKSVLAAGGLTIGLLLFLVPRYGLLGAALGQFLANVVTNLGYSAWHFARLVKSLKESAQDA